MRKRLFIFFCGYSIDRGYRRRLQVPSFNPQIYRTEKVDVRCAYCKRIRVWCQSHYVEYNSRSPTLKVNGMSLFEKIPTEYIRKCRCGNRYMSNGFICYFLQYKMKCDEATSFRSQGRSRVARVRLFEMKLSHRTN